MKEQTNRILRASPAEDAPPFGRRDHPDRTGRIKPDDRVVSLVAPATMEAEQYRTLGLMLEQRRQSGLLQILAVSSPTVGDGKTLTSVNLAAALAQPSTSRVLLIDTDVRRPSVPVQLGLRDHDGPGFRDAIVNRNLALKDLARRLSPWNLSIVTAGSAEVMPHEIFKSARFAELLGEARREYEWIVLDTSPLVLAPDCLMLAPSVDGFLLVVRAHKTSRKELGEALTILGPSKLLGLVFNYDDGLRDSYGYGRYYYPHQPAS